MPKQPLPWESVSGPKLSARDTLPRKGWVKAGGWVLVAVLSAVAVLTVWRVAGIFAVLYALALLMEKSVAVTNRGLEIFHDMRLTTNYELWAWADIYSITYEPDPKNSAQTLLYFTKGDRTKRFSFANGDAKAVLSLAREQRGGIKLYDGREMRGKARRAGRR